MAIKRSEFITVGEARAILSVSPTKMAKLIQTGALEVFEDPLDARKKLVRRRAIEEMAQTIDEAKKLAPVA